MTWQLWALVFVLVAVVAVGLVMAGADRLFNHVDDPKHGDETAPDPTAPGNASTTERD